MYYKNFKQELQQIAFNYSSDIDFKDFVNLYKKCFPRSYVLAIKASLPSVCNRRLFTFQKEYFREKIKINYDK